MSERILIYIYNKGNVREKDESEGMTGDIKTRLECFSQRSPTKHSEAKTVNSPPRQLLITPLSFSVYKSSQRLVNFHQELYSRKFKGPRRGVPLKIIELWSIFCKVLQNLSRLFIWIENWTEREIIVD